MAVTSESTTFPKTFLKRKQVEKEEVSSALNKAVESFVCVNERSILNMTRYANQILRGQER